MEPYWMNLLTSHHLQPAADQPEASVQAGKFHLWMISLPFPNGDKKKRSGCLDSWINLSYFPLREWSWGRGCVEEEWSPGGVREWFRVQASQQDILFEPPNTISSNKKGETFEIISHRRDTETLIVTLARGQGWGGRLPSHRASGQQSKSTSRKSLKLKVDEKACCSKKNAFFFTLKNYLHRGRCSFQGRMMEI